MFAAQPVQDNLIEMIDDSGYHYQESGLQWCAPWLLNKSPLQIFIKEQFFHFALQLTQPKQGQLVETACRGRRMSSQVVMTNGPKRIWDFNTTEFNWIQL